MGYDIVFTVSGAVAVCIIIVCLVLLLARWQHGNNNNLKSRELGKHFSREGPHKFSYSLLRAATDNFSNNQMLAKGGFGQV